jgi:archaemetzincin
VRFVLSIAAALTVLLGLALWSRSTADAPVLRAPLPVPVPVPVPVPAPAPGSGSARSALPPPPPRPPSPPAATVATDAPSDLGPPTDPSDPRGDVSRLSKALRRALDPTDGFAPIHESTAADWLVMHPEPGQTFEQFRGGERNTPFPGRDVIRVFPLDAFQGEVLPALDVLVEYAAAFFMMPVKVTTPERLPTFTTRKGRAGPTQTLSTDVLNWLKFELPSDTFCGIAVTSGDLYPEPAWNFVFGQASFTERVGVFGFARYDPAFPAGKRPEGAKTLVLRRATNVMAHEIGHMFGMEHCVHFACVMNGSNSLDEADREPGHLCPVCLRKLQHAVGFDVVERYRKIEAFDRAHGLVEEADWNAARIAHITRK